ncbi:FAD-dependent oxidoreductase [Shewanella electrodiphila]|uniref:FAD-dependent oxidoreductase n=1 Tax=Shewanella electrodiphila TaxID=934143 RepID=A0ABT0KSN9_9GAMM|nr:FAD-dependent oxidoreductase [Shewanella electrodiphila]MCL1046541.1 FAD-dependent oxidoreductase [Shewanella electrodiphila]
MKLKSLTVAVAILASGNALAVTEYNTELVIVGSGVAGLTAAAYAEENGIDTIVIEKLATTGGQLVVIEGTYAVESKTTAANMVGLTKQESFEETMDYAGWRANPALVKRIIDDSANNIHWMIDRGIKMGPLITDTVDGHRVYHTYEGHAPGAQAIGVLTDIITKNGGQIFTETPGNKLIINNKGVVTGILAESEDEGEIQINAKAVLMATGSIANSTKLLTKFAPELSIKGQPLKSIALPGNTGDGVTMGIAVGADLDNENLVIGESLVPTNTLYKEMYSSPVMMDAYMMLKTHSLWVNFNGDRYLNEALSGDFTIVNNATLNQGNQAFVIIDNVKREDLMTGGGSDTNYFTMYNKGQLMPHFDDAIKDGQKRGYAFKANSISELANIMGVNQKNLQTTVDRYNKLAKEGVDHDFGKSNQHLKPIMTPPFFALKGDSTICDMGGGLKINHKSQVVSIKGEIIKGLYAAGATAGGMYGTNYPYINPGFASASSLATGRFAVEDVAELLNKKIKKL